MTARSNILYIHSHDTGRRIQPYGYDVPTPQLQRLADQGVLFRQAFCVSPTCSPSRAGLLTGQYPYQCGQWGLSNAGYPLLHPERHWVATLRTAGYHTALLGVQHVADDERNLGYDEVRDAVIGGSKGVKNPEMCATQVGPVAEEWIGKHARDDAPWFLDAGMVQTHNASWRRLAPYERPTTRDKDRARPPAGLPDVPESREWQAYHCAMAAQLDAAVGRILSAVEHHGLAEHTLVVYTTDHGIGLPDHKCSLHDGGLEVALILRGPHFWGGRTIPALVSHLDVFPTLCELCGITAPSWLEGRSLLPLVAGERSIQHDALFAELNVHGVPQPERSVRTERYRLIRRWWTDPDQAGRNSAGIVSDWLKTQGWPERVRGGREVTPDVHDELFDLWLDPLERRDRSLDPQYADVYGDHAARLEEWMRTMRDPVAEQGADGIPARASFEKPDIALQNR